MSTHESMNVGSAVEIGDFREALSRFASGVTVVTTIDGDERQWGFTANAFCSLSIDPPLVLVCLDESAECYQTFMNAERFMINILPTYHEQLALRFAKKGTDKFVGGGFLADQTGLPILQDAIGTLRCAAHARLDGGDHIILIGRVEEAEHRDDAPPLLYFRGGFHELSAEGKP